MQIEGITAFITGGASGLGEATARMLALRGANVALYDLPRSKGAELEKQIGSAARFLPGDVTDEAQVNAPAGFPRAFDRGRIGRQGNEQGPDHAGQRPGIGRRHAARQRHGVVMYRAQRIVDLASGQLDAE